MNGTKTGDEQRTTNTRTHIEQKKWRKKKRTEISKERYDIPPRIITLELFGSFSVQLADNNNNNNNMKQDTLVF